ncbi:futalosine hydrolase [Streptomyces sp. bgisy154]|uniref:futalosine hydrolase n=1 Tax=Streptomyces sp. bgisy154 TaxID=3413794 RepID=UPI003D708E4D
MKPVRLLIVTAVEAERDAVISGFGPAVAVAASGPPGRELLRLTCSDTVTCGDTRRAPSASRRRPLTADLLAGGVGPAAAAAATGAALALAAAREAPYDLVISAGIAGGFAPVAAMGSVVVADRVIAADLGCETPDGFLPVDRLGFGTSEHTCPPHLAAAVARALGAVHAPVLTVSTATGTEDRARTLRRHHAAAAEAMEGFGVAEAAAAHGIPMLEVRTVSNPVGPRDRAAWRIPDALAALRDAFAVLGPVFAHGAHPLAADRPS